MRLLMALLLAAACALARPPGPVATLSPDRERSPYRRPVPPLTAQEYVGDYLYERFLLPHFRNVVPREPAPIEYDWLSKEIDHINEMQNDEERSTTYDENFSKWIGRDPYLQRMIDNARIQEIPSYEPRIMIPNRINSQIPPPRKFISPETQAVDMEPKENEDKRDKSIESETNEKFALTPLDKGYFDIDANMGIQSPLPMEEHVMHEGGNPQMAMLLEPPRQIRQNPLSRSKTLVAENLDRLRTGLTSKDYRLPVSLLPTNLRWLKINHSGDDDDEYDEKSSHEETHSTDKPRHVHILETAKDPAESIYGVALIAAIGAAITMAVFGFAIGWYTLFKKAKAAADVDYPAYGVTGPTVDTSGDRKLAHSAHMYHYQHQKQQIIAMERNGLEQRNGSVSDPESEEENEEGDYTVYECPGFATTGEMEVKNPLFTEDPTPATPGKCEVVKPQPKD